MHSSAAHNRRAVLFDLGGTLIYFEGRWPEVLAESNREMLRILQEGGLALEGEAFLNDFQRRLRAYDEQCGPDFIEYTTAAVLKELLGAYGYPEVPASTLREALAARYAVSQRHWQVEADAAPILQILRQAGYALGIVSNAGDDADVQTLVDRAGIRPFFDVILSSASEGIRKPNPRIFFTALQRLGATPERTVMVGDTLGADIQGAQNAGIYAIWITRRADVPANRAHRDTIRPDAAIASLAELPRLLEKLF